MPDTGPQQAETGHWRVLSATSEDGLYKPLTPFHGSVFSAHQEMWRLRREEPAKFFTVRYMKDGSE